MPATFALRSPPSNGWRRRHDGRRMWLLRCQSGIVVELSVLLDGRNLPTYRSKESGSSRPTSRRNAVPVTNGSSSDAWDPNGPYK